MKLVKMSMVAALLVGSSAFAIDNVKVDGNANLFYSTSDHTEAIDMFDKAGAIGQASLGLGISADLTESVSAGAHLTALSTLGLEGQLVSGVWEGTNGTDDYFWFDQAWLAATAGKTTAQVGRMALDTPLVFTESWSIAQNTFEAAVVVNQDLPDTTLVGAYVGGSNGGFVGQATRTVIAPVNANGTTNFSQFYKGAFAAGVVNNSLEDVTLQAWYYDATQVVQAYWLQADVEIEGISFGAQYTAQEANGASTQSAYALELGYEMKDKFAVAVAYSAVGDETDGLGNVGANLAASGQSKLYTEAWWAYGVVSAVDTTAITVEAEVPVEGIADFGAYYTMADNGAANNAGDLTELTLTASRSYGALDATLAYINTTEDGGDAYNMLQAYLTLNF